MTTRKPRLGDIVAYYATRCEFHKDSEPSVGLIVHVSKVAKSAKKGVVHLITFGEHGIIFNPGKAFSEEATRGRWTWFPEEGELPILRASEKA